MSKKIQVPVRTEYHFQTGIEIDNVISLWEYQDQITEYIDWLENWWEESQKLKNDS